MEGVVTPVGHETKVMPAPIKIELSEKDKDRLSKAEPHPCV